MQEKYRAVLWVFMHFLTGSAKSNSFYISFLTSHFSPLLCYHLNFAVISICETIL